MRTTSDPEPWEVMSRRVRAMCRTPTRQSDQLDPRGIRSMSEQTSSACMASYGLGSQPARCPHL